MKVLVVGGGGREHAIVWKLSQSPRITKLYCAPGNGGIASLAQCIDIKATDIERIVAFAKEEQIDLTVVAPDDPLAMGLVDDAVWADAKFLTFTLQDQDAVVEDKVALTWDIIKGCRLK
jgi:phosphoribosylamine--glycine ligase